MSRIAKSREYINPPNSTAWLTFPQNSSCLIRGWKRSQNLLLGWGHASLYQLCRQTSSEINGLELVGPISFRHSFETSCHMCYPDADKWSMRRLIVGDRERAETLGPTVFNQTISLVCSDDVAPSPPFTLSSPKFPCATCSYYNCIKPRATWHQVMPFAFRQYLPEMI